VTTTRRYVRRATTRDMHFFQNPQLWLQYPWLPVTRQAIDSGPQELGVLYDARGISGIYGYACTVWVANLFCLPQTESEFLALPKHVYDNWEELANDGWTVD
jgi:hypothetical protein